MLNKVIIVYFFVHKIYSCSLRKITAEHLMSHFTILPFPCYISGPGNITVVLLSMKSQIGLHQKYLNLCSEDRQRSYEIFG